MSAKRRHAMLASLVVVWLFGGCQTVAPWERGTLARPEMQLDPDRLATALADQIHESKEAASGGSRTAGAGCGCN